MPDRFRPSFIVRGRLRPALLSTLMCATLVACGGGEDERVVLKPNRAPFPLV